MAVTKQDADNAAFDVVGVAEENLPENSRLATEQSELAQSNVSFNLPIIKRTPQENIQINKLFQSKTWNTLHPQSLSSSLALSPVSSSPPSAPLLPFMFIGRMIDGHDVILFLSKNSRQYAVKMNDILDDTYRVDKITDDSLVLTYLPMNIQQTLAFNPVAEGGSILRDSASGATIQPTPQLQIDSAS
jgi:hypothetical protein